MIFAIEGTQQKVPCRLNVWSHKVKFFSLTIHRAQITANAFVNPQ